jgi:hypothetical protein
VLGPDERGGDTFGPASGLGKEEARNVATITIAMELLIFARSPDRSGTVVDHDDQARDIARQLVVGVAHVLTGYGINRWRFQPGRFLGKDEIDERKLTQWPGRIYRLGLSWDEAVRDEDYKGAGADTVDGGDVLFETTTETEGAGGNELPSASTEVP